MRRKKGIDFPVGSLIAVATLAFLTGGCTAFKTLAAATRDKSVAAGSDTWGGGFEAKTASVETPVPSVEGWFGRRRVWYVSVKDAATGRAAAEAVKAGNSPVSLDAGASGVTLSQ